MSTSIEVRTFAETETISIEASTSIVFIGANGAGKTRLGVFIDNRLSNQNVDVHRIAAHRSLNLNPKIVPPNYEIATNRLFYGHDDGKSNQKSIHRFGRKPETILLNDFDHVLSALYAENNDVSIKHRQACIENPHALLPPPSAKIDELKSIWETVLPHRELVVLGGNLKTRTLDGEEYPASEMSDGERVIFYLIAQALLAKPDTLLIFDEPELHINKSILAKLWDEIESARADCAFMYITHDVEFASSRHAATKYALRSYRKAPHEAWDIELIPDEDEIPDDVVATIIGSRRPILLVEGDGGSLDSSLYRRVYDTFTVIPVGSCNQVVHTVTSFAARSELHRVGCAGLVDADGRTDEEVQELEKRGIYCLPVSEVENLLLLPSVFLELAKTLKFSETDGQSRLKDLQEVVFSQANRDMDGICVRYTKRRIDSAMKKIGLSETDISGLDTEFKSATMNIEPRTIFADVKATLSTAVEQQDYEKVLLYYDNKGLLCEVAKKLGFQQKSLEEFIGRALRSDESSSLHSALKACLPTITPRP